MTFTLRWGIMATGGIAKSFASDLLLNPAERNAEDITHAIGGVASSSSQSKAQEFIDGVGIPSAKAYGSYEELVANPDLDIIYVATPQSRHYEDALLALNAQKHVLCEKPFTINAEQAAHLISVAKSNNRFLMEAAWTRFFPHTRDILSDFHNDQRIGSIKRLFADFSLKVTDSTSRLYDPNLGGGALLDLGFYPVTWAFLILYKHPRNERTLPKVSATMTLTERGVDEFTSATLSFEKLRAVAYLTTSLSARTPRPYSILVQGDEGDVVLSGAPPRPLSYTVRREGQEPEERTLEYTGNGLIWQADACARAIRDGKTECEECSLEDTLLITKLMDEIRRQGGLRFPDPLENLSVGVKSS